jgi:hypothetical protein
VKLLYWQQNYYRLVKGKIEIFVFVDFSALFDNPGHIRLMYSNTLKLARARTTDIQKLHRWLSAS